jgi:hypothetical protein
MATENVAELNGVVREHPEENSTELYRSGEIPLACLWRVCSIEFLWIGLISHQIRNMLVVCLQQDSPLLAYAAPSHY